MRSGYGALDLERAKDILRYFLRHPQAADNLEGIARWRLMQERVQRGVEETERALQWLVSQGYLSAEDAGSAPPIFRLNQQKRAKAEQFLKLEERGGNRKGKQSRVQST